MQIKFDNLRIKIIKPFYGHNHWRTKPLAIGKVLNYGANPERGKKLIEDGIAIEYKDKVIARKDNDG
jgi:hypothetical protein